MINSIDLVNKFQYVLDNHWGYIYGASGDIWTQAKQDASTREQTVKWGQRWVGKHVVDCSGLFVWAYKQLGSSIYHGSNSIWNKSLSSKGKLVNGNRDDGNYLNIATAVFKTSGSDRHHIGLYVGGGIVIEAKGTYYGVVTSKVSEWDEWGELQSVDYKNKSEQQIPVGKARVKGGTLRLRKDASTESKALANVKTGEIVDIIPETDDWTHVEYKGTKGYMMSAFLEKGGES